MESVDVLIAGGGAVGSAVAYFLKEDPAFSGNVLVVEPDPTYAYAASARSAGSVRQQFSTPLNIALSAFGMDFLRSFHRSIGDIGLVEATYLYLATERGAGTLRRNIEVQRACGVGTRTLDAADLATRYPWVNAADLAIAADTTGGEGWFDGYALLRGLRRVNEARGVRYLRDRVATVIMDGRDRVKGARLGHGASLRCRWFVNAAGTHSRRLAADAGIDLPVYARKRSVFVFDCAASQAAAPAASVAAAAPVPVPTRCPMVIDPCGLWFRSERERFICGGLERDDPDAAEDDFEPDLRLFEEAAWPALAHRVPAFEALRLATAWAGHYDYNVFDQNAFLGNCAGVDNFVLASGFSGHGLQHAPAVGRALAELVTHGEYRSLDVSPFSYLRYQRHEPLRELNII